MKIIINNIELNKYELLHFINNGKKLNAIKLVKTKTNLGLKECKDVINNLTDDPNFYDNNAYVSKTGFIDAYEKSKKTTSRKVSHIIKSNPTNYKNYVILFLLFFVVVLIYMYVSK